MGHWLSRIGAFVGLFGLLTLLLVLLSGNYEGHQPVVAISIACFGILIAIVGKLLGGEEP